MNYDVAIIGGGVVGALVARELSKTTAKVVTLEKGSDVAEGATKANSGIAHAGFDCVENSLKAYHNVRGSQMMQELTSELDVEYNRNGAMVVGFNSEDEATLGVLLERGKRNGVKNLEIITGDRARELEPNLAKEITLALYARDSGIVCPYTLAINAMGNAMDNGVELKTEFEVVSIENLGEFFEINSPTSSVKARFVVNCAGVYSGKIAEMIGDKSINITARKGEYLLLDKGHLMTTATIFGVPTKLGKGVLLAPTTHGNYILGPTSEIQDSFEDKDTTQVGQNTVKMRVKQLVANVPLNCTITSFAGVRAVGNSGDFIIGKSKVNEKFINVAGIESPGLTSAPSIALSVVEILESSGLNVAENTKFVAQRRTSGYKKMDNGEKNEFISHNPLYGRIVCRCESITEGEIVEAIRTNPPAKTLDAVKRRTRSGMGRCQGGFCTSIVMEILARETHQNFSDITKSGGNSRLIIGKTK